jgi:cyclohexyl-isocyanide hydratase
MEWKSMPKGPHEAHLDIGAIIFPMMDQIDFTGPFEVLSRLPDSTFHVIAKDLAPVRDMRGLLLTPEETLAQAPQLDLLLVPGGFGQEALMDDETVLSFIRQQAADARIVMSVCTGALVCGAAGLLKGRRATTNWTVHHLLGYFGATPVDERVVVDGNLVTTAGVTAGIDGALRVASILRGDDVAQNIQLFLEYAPEPPFNSGTPATAPARIVEAARNSAAAMVEKRLATAKRIAQRLGVSPV